MTLRADPIDTACQLTIMSEHMGTVALGALSPRRFASMIAIERVATRLFIERGYASVTPEQIAEAGDISLRTFYRYFPEGKEGVLLLETRRGLELFHDALCRRPPNELAIDALREAALESVRRIDDPASAIAPIGVRETQDLFRQLTDIPGSLLARLIGERVRMLEPLVQLVALRMSLDPSVDVRPRMLVHAVNAAVTASWLTAHANPDLDLDDVLQASLVALELGLAPTIECRADRRRRTAS